MESVYVVSLGCPKNLVDTEKMLASYFKEGIVLAKTAEDADVIFINTCSFIEAAKEEAVETIFDYIALKEKYPSKKVIVSGCLWEQNREELEREIPEVQYLSNKESVFSSDRFFLGGSHAYLKVSEGCNRFCSFCTIPLFKGRYRSRKIEDIVKEARALSEVADELIVVSQDNSSYGSDIYESSKLYELLKELCELDFKWIRLMYLYPTDFDFKILDLMNEKPNFVKYIDIPLQHLSDSLLKQMNRKGSFKEYLSLIEKIREIVPDITIRSTFIIGFPGETEQDFEFLLDGLDQLQLNKAGFFAYSDEEGTKAFSLNDKIELSLIEQRVSKATFIQEEISEELLALRVGKTYEVLVEGFDEQSNSYFGRSCFEAPEIDGLVFFESEESLDISSFVNVKITDSDENDLRGVFVHE